jgi:lysozyme family protein
MIEPFVNIIEALFPKRKTEVFPGPIGRPTGGSTKVPDFEDLWASCEIDPEKRLQVEEMARKVLASFPRYDEVQRKTGVPWYLVGAIHLRESSGRFDRCFHNGDPLPGPTTHVPAGRGPFPSWESSAVDALTLLGLHHLKIDGPIQALVVAEQFNGLGYRRHGVYSPYLWAGTNHSLEIGKFTADGKFDPLAPEKQVGVAAVIHLLLEA